MSKFKVDLNAQDRPERFTAEGDYTVVIENAEKALTSQGFEKAIITFKDDRNRSIKDDILNKETVYWRLNQLVIATSAPLAQGAEYDFTKSGEFFNFVKGFVGMKLTISLKSEEYTNKDGEKKSILKVSKYSKPRSTTDEPF